MTRLEFQLRVCHEMDGFLADAGLGGRTGMEFRQWFRQAQASIQRVAGELYDEVAPKPPLVFPPAGTPVPAVNGTRPVPRILPGGKA